MSLLEAVQEFKRNVTSNLLAPGDFIDWAAVHAALTNAGNAVRYLEDFRAIGDLSQKALAAELGSHPQIYDVALSLVAFNTSASQMDKWGLPANVPRDLLGRDYVAGQLLYVGLDQILSNPAPVADLLRVAEVYKDSFRRRFRSGDRFKTEVARIVNGAVMAAAKQLGAPFRIQPESLADTQLRRSLEYVVSIAGRPVAGIATVFANHSGGRQQRDFSVIYPLLQQRLAEYGMSLVLIADGQGLREASERSLLQLFEAVQYPMTLKQAEVGALEAALVKAGAQPPPETIDAAAVGRLVAGALDVRPKLSAADLPLARGPAVLALARYAESHRMLDLQLSSAGDELAWTHSDLVAEARALVGRFDGQRALRLISSRIGSPDVTIRTDLGISRATLNTPDVPPFTGKVLAVAHGQGLTPELRRSTGLEALELAPGSSFALLLSERDLNPSDVEAHRKRQAVLPVNIILIGPQLLSQITRSADPIRTLTDAILDQSDLTKVSPYILSNATPSRMFYGRESEAATILGTLGTNSVALLGSRRIGKTSLLRRVRSDLEEANYLPFFGDCQTVRTWDDFARLASAEWGVFAPANFRPQHLGEIVRELSAGSDKPLIILLDEIDQLLEWDHSHADDSVPEAFFRTCRSLSQDRVVQFIFSGERTIAQRLWDPQSPHWNFCRPLALSQLTREAATSLLIQPLKGLNIRLPDEAAFGAEAWRLTSGHPQIVQYLGDRLVRKLDEERNRRDLDLDVGDIGAVSETYDFAEHYLNTYWGQANQIERDITLLVADSPIAVKEIHSELHKSRPALGEFDLLTALRMLQLYGIVEETEGLIHLRATWFRHALSYFGDLQTSNHAAGKR